MEILKQPQAQPLNLTISKILAGNPELKLLLLTYLANRNLLLHRELRGAQSWEKVLKIQGCLDECEALANVIAKKVNENANG